MGVERLESVQEEEGSLEDARKTIAFLKETQKSQARVIIAWKNKYKNENAIVTKLKRKKDEHLKHLQSQLLIFESYLQKTRVEFENLVKHKDDVIKRQHQLICNVALALVKRGGQDDLKKLLPGIKVESTTSSACSTLERKTNYSTNEKDAMKKDLILFTSSKSDNENLNDSDSAIMMEDAYDSLIVLPTGKGEVRVMRSVSDALEIVARVASTNNKNSCQNTGRRNISHGSLSSTPSGSSEESDESPPTTMNKGCCELIRPNHIMPRLDMSSNSPSKNTYSSTKHSCKSPSCLSSFNSSNSFSSNNSSTDSYLLYSGDNQSQYSTYDSNSTTPLATPGQSPSSSVCTTPSASPLVVHSPQIVLDPDLCPTFEDSDTTLSDGESDREYLDTTSITRLSERGLIEPSILYGSYEKLTDYQIMCIRKKPKDEINQVTYNRVMSNHRSVTKPKDVKYKRINKAKSRSLEELRGKLKLWDINKQCLSIELGQSDA